MSVLATKALGKVDVDPAEVVHFSDGLLGFHEYQDFVVLREKQDSVFLWLQSATEPGLAFVIIEPALFLKDYKPQLAPGDLDPLATKSFDDLHVYLIVTIPENHPEKMTANLQGPVLINPTKKLGRQVISHHASHHVRVSILEQLES